jgi:DnaK suppressor protein
VHCADDKKGGAEEHPLIVEHSRHDKRRQEHRDQRDEQRAADDAYFGIDGIRQRRVGRPRPRERGQHEHPTANPGQGRIVGYQRRDLREREHEDQVEEELSRRDAVLVGCNRRHATSIGRVPMRRIMDEFSVRSRTVEPERARELLKAERERIEQALARLAHQDSGELAERDEPADAASDLYQDELDEGLADDLREQLAAVERAEERLAAGTYGLSVESGQPIPDERLDAIPTAERTAEEEARR